MTACYIATATVSQRWIPATTLAASEQSRKSKTLTACRSVGRFISGKSAIMRLTTLPLILLFISCSVTAKPYRGDHDLISYHSHRSWARHSHLGITCEMVRAYVEKFGMGQAIMTARAAGMTASEEGRARRCLGLNM